MNLPRTRFAPSPTGFLHIGGARTALFSYLYARRHGGVFVLRVEDTDTSRSTQESIDQILEAMHWLGLVADEGPYFQMQRLDRYRSVAEQLVAAGKAYRCYCSREELEAMREAQRARGLKPRYDGRCRARSAAAPGVEPVVRFKNPEHGQVRLHDRIHGDVIFDNAELDDLVILRSDGVPTYNFAVVIDDGDMRITHVIRGDDHLNNTPRQLNLLEALELPVPEYAHVPMILGADGSRLSKRHGAVSVLAYRDAGYLPEALLNYLVRLGWSHGDQEVFSLDEMVRTFDLEHVSRSPASFDPDKLLWLNQQWLKRTAADAVAARLRSFIEKRGLDVAAGPPLPALVDVQRDRARTLEEMAEKSVFAFRDPETYEPKAAAQHLTDQTRPILELLASRFERLHEWSVETTQAAVESAARELAIGMGKVAQPLRVAVTGTTASPGIGQTLALIGREKTLARVRKAIDYAGHMQR